MGPLINDRQAIGEEGGSRKCGPYKCESLLTLFEWRWRYSRKVYIKAWRF